MKEKLIYILERDQQWFSKRGKPSGELTIVLDYLKNGVLPNNPECFPLLQDCMKDIEKVYFEYGIVIK